MISTQTFWFPFPQKLLFFLLICINLWRTINLHSLCQLVTVYKQLWLFFLWNYGLADLIPTNWVNDRNHLLASTLQKIISLNFCLWKKWISLSLSMRRKTWRILLFIVFLWKRRCYSTMLYLYSFKQTFHIIFKLFQIFLLFWWRKTQQPACGFIFNLQTF